MFESFRGNGKPSTGTGYSGGPKPQRNKLFVRYANGAVQPNATRKLRGTRKNRPHDGDIK